MSRLHLAQDSRRESGKQVRAIAVYEGEDSLPTLHVGHITFYMQYQMLLDEIETTRGPRNPEDTAAENSRDPVP